MSKDQQPRAMHASEGLAAVQPEPVTVAATPSWQLEDADPIAAENPYTFYKPSRELISRVRAGEVVKLIFRFNSDDPEAPSAERMWVLVDEVLADGCFRGRLNNEPCHIQDLLLDDPVAFQACHVINTEHDDDNNLVERYEPPRVSRRPVGLSQTVAA